MKLERLAALAVVVPMLALAAAVHWLGRTAHPGAGEPDVAVFDLTGVAADGVWTLEAVTGLNYWWKTFTPATLYVTEGQEVVLNLRSADLLHCFYLPEFAVGPVDVEPGHMVSVRFVADTSGLFQYYCTVMCGGCHFYMRGWVVVTPPGEEPLEPPPIYCPLCGPDIDPPAPDASMVEVGSYLYTTRGCITCHGLEGRGGVANPNSVNSPVPRHDSTAQKLFLASPDDADAFIALVGREPDLDEVQEAPGVTRFPVVRARFENAKEIIRKGRFSARADPAGPIPPLQMPAWEFLLAEREIDSLLVYFVSLCPWEEVGW